MKRTFEQLDFIIRQTNEIAVHFDKHEPNNISMFSMCMLDRLNFGAESLKILLERVEQKPQVDFGSGVIIRSLLLDYLIVLNAFEIFERNLSNSTSFENELKEYCLMMLCDSVRNTLEYFNSLRGNVPDALLTKMYKNLVASNPNCFEGCDENGQPLIKIKKYKSPKKLFETLMNSKSLKKFRGIYTAYLYYSKYDHFGNIYYGLSRQSKEQQKSFIQISINVLPEALLIVASILTFLKGENSWMDLKRQEILAYINKYKEFDGVREQ